MYNNYKVYITKHAYKSSILNLKYSIIVFLKTNITINVIIIIRFSILRFIINQD